MRWSLSKLVPDVIKQKIKRSDYYNQRKAVCLAASNRRVDICAAQFAHNLHLSKHSSLEGKVCLEIGAGWVLTHAIVCHLLGAKKVIATDIAPLAHPEAISVALKKAVAYIPIDLLSPFSDHELIRERFKRLLSIPRFNFKILKKFGIEYQSPVDFTSAKLGLPIDFIYSFAVLEHVSENDVSMLVNNLFDNLQPGGTMIHRIHLEDHKDSEEKPFDFLGIEKSKYTHKLQSERGNRIRCSKWKSIFDNLEGAESDFLFRYLRTDKALPKAIDASIDYCDECDLRTSRIGVYTRKEK